MKDYYFVKLPLGTDDERIRFATLLILDGFTFECRPEFPQFIVWADRFDRAAMRNLYNLIVGALASSRPEVPPP